jgi:hypothetical protein
MSFLRVLAGFTFSVIVGHLVLWWLIEKTLWPSIRRRHAAEPEHQKSRLSWMVGVLERAIYTGALMMPGSGIQIIAGFLAVKVAARWHGSSGPRATADSDNIWIIGTWLSVLFGVAGAWIALGHLPELTNIKTINLIQ